MYTFDVEFTAIMKELKTKRFTNIWGQEQLSEKIWHLLKSVIEQQVEETECLTQARSEIKELKERRRILKLLVDHEQHWIETMDTVSE